MKLLLPTIIMLIYLIGCAPVRDKSYLEYAHDAYQRGDFIAAYRLSEDYFDDGTQQGHRAILFVKSDPRILNAGISTFSKTSLEETIMEYGDRISAAREERNRLLLFRIVASQDQFNKALKNFDEVFPGYYKDAENQERLLAEKRRQEEKIFAEKKKQQEIEMLHKEQELLDAVNNAKVICNSVLECNKMFSLTQIYINKYSTMKIQLATNTIIETYNITGESGVAMKAVKIPSKGLEEEISITVSCKPFPSDTCYDTMMIIYRSFPKYIHARLK